jgi:dihydrofolate reductase
MAKLVYAAITSLDGYTEDASGGFGWARPDEEVHAYVNDMERDIGTYLYGRRMYETMVYWETAEGDGAGPEDEYAGIWRAADKVVYSTTLEDVASARTRLERSFAPEAVRQLKADATQDISIGGAGLAAVALGAGLVDEVHLFLNPVSVGGGKPALPRDARVDLELLDEHRFAGGVVHLRYRVAV